MGCSHLTNFGLMRFALVLALLLLTGIASANAPDIGTRYLFLDARGDVTLATDGSGNAVQSSRYGPWGKLIRKSGDNGVQPAFTGQELDSATGLHYFNARYYDAGLGRFLSPDPLRQFHSPYLYAYNAPLAYIDPTGAGAETLFLGFNPVQRYLAEGPPTRSINGRSVALQPLIVDPIASHPTLLRAAYYFGSPVLVDGTVFVPSKRIPSAQLRMATSYFLNANNYMDLFSTIPANEWLASQADRSLMLIVPEHRSIGLRLMVLDRLERWVMKVDMCLDLGCRMRRMDQRANGIVSKSFTDLGIKYVHSGDRVRIANLDDGLPGLVGNREPLDWARTVRGNQASHLLEFYISKGGAFTRNELRNPSRPPAWYVSLPASDRFKVSRTVHYVDVRKTRPRILGAWVRTLRF